MTSSAVAGTIVPAAIVEATIAHYTALDRVRDQKTMNKMARRLGKEQPALLQFASSYQDEHGDATGEAAVFYCTLVWSIFDRSFPRKLHRLTDENIEDAKDVVLGERNKLDDLDDRPAHRRYAETLAARQPHIYKKLEELLAEDLQEEAITEECAEIILVPTQVMVEAFDAALDGRRPGERHGPVVRETAKVGRNEPCPCGSGKKYKKCHGRDA